MKTMFTRNKSFAIFVCSFLILVLALPQSYTGYMFGKKYNPQRDFTCCKNDQLYIHHYYTYHLFWVKTDSGFAEEPLGKPVSGGCNIQCEN
jgi:hypothetical protein